MSQDYVEYLAITVLNEQQLVSYRSLSRALKIHGNLAKQMLYEFHRKQNAKKHGTVHATYLLTGTKKSGEGPEKNGLHSQDGEDTVMQSSPPFPSSSAPKSEEAAEEVIARRSVMVVREEHLEQARATFETITGVHVYSLEANGLSDMQTLTECNRRVMVSYASEDPLQAGKQYGMIQNPNAKRRTQRKPPPLLAPVAKDAETISKPLAPAKQPPMSEKQSSKDPQESKAQSNPTPATTTPWSEKTKTTKPAAPKRQDSDIFKSFAKSAAKPRRTDTESSAEVSPGPDPEAETVDAFSDDEPEEDVPIQEEDVKAPSGKSKKERHAELEAMMDHEDESMEDAPTPAGIDADEDHIIEKPLSQQHEEPQEIAKVENGRRRGRRRVMKKKTVKDEDGYLVTKEEPAWESFSEDEPVPKKIKVPAATTMNKPAGGKKGGKPGQGNIMSFFSKK